MDVIFEGRLSDDWSIRELLQAVHAQSGVANGVLRLSSQQNNIGGKVAFTAGRVIVGALTDSGLSGYDALRGLLSIPQGSFAFLDAGGTAVDVERNLHIDLESVVSMWPRLPDNPAELFDEKALLDEVFGAGSAPAAPPISKPVHRQQKNAPAKPKTTTSGTWRLFGQLTQEGAPAKNNSPLLSGITSSIMPDFSEGRATFGRLRAHDGNGDFSQIVIKIAVALLIIFVIGILGLLAVNRYNAPHASPRAVHHRSHR